MGAGCEVGTDVGPVISQDSRDRVEGLIQSGIDQGGRLVCGGQRPQVDGYPQGMASVATVYL